MTHEKLDDGQPVTFYEKVCCLHASAMNLKIFMGTHANSGMWASFVLSRAFQHFNHALHVATS